MRDLTIEETNQVTGGILGEVAIGAGVASGGAVAFAGAVLIVAYAGAIMGAIEAGHDLGDWLADEFVDE